MTWGSSRKDVRGLTFTTGQLYDLVASDNVRHRRPRTGSWLADYHREARAITPLVRTITWRVGFASRNRFAIEFGKFNTQIWAYHLVQAAIYECSSSAISSDQKECMRRSRLLSCICAGRPSSGSSCR